MGKTKLIRAAGICAFLVAGTLGVLTGWALWANNQAQGPVPREEVRQAYERSLEWIGAHRREVLDDENPMLWWMLKRSAELRGDARLIDLYSSYRAKYLDRRPGNVWRHVLGEDPRPKIRLWEIDHLPDYNLFILFGASCSEELANSPLVRNQLISAYCASFPSVGYFRYPSCVTHEMMGAYFLVQSGCEDRTTAKMLAADLKQRALRHLFWDFRVTDVYLQRVMMLAAMGAGNEIRPSWIRAVIGAQNADGGWADFHSVLPISESAGAGFYGRGFGISTRTSNFHTTIQGTYLMSLLLANGHDPAYRASYSVVH